MEKTNHSNFELEKLIDSEKLKRQGIVLIKRGLNVQLLEREGSSTTQRKLNVGHVYTIYGKEIHNLTESILYKNPADNEQMDTFLKLQQIYQTLFNKSDVEDFYFSTIIFLNNPVAMFLQIKRIYEKYDSETEFRLFLEELEKYSTGVLDCYLEFNVKIQRDDSTTQKNQLYFESKMFTVPLNPKNKLQPLEESLTLLKLKHDFQAENLDYYVLFTFSFLSEPTRELLPILLGNESCPTNLRSTWCIHLVFIGPQILSYLSTSTGKDKTSELAGIIYDAIHLNQDDLVSYLRRICGLHEKMNFKVIPDTIIVLLLLRYIKNIRVESKENNSANEYQHLKH
ncbi:MAG: hypothetical protein ACTSXP_01485 [Promethearchaeota archaeon]